jgi:hypothetical protein
MSTFDHRPPVLRAGEPETPSPSVRTAAPGPAGGPLAQSVLHLQRSCGNRHVQRMVTLARQAAGEAGAGELDPEVESSIQRSRGGGQALDSTVRAQMEPTLGADLSGVRVHTGSEADSLNRAVSARAFTTGSDVFFRKGEYNPGTSSGRELIAHELTHVVQQDSAPVQAKLTLGAVDTPEEKEADEVARQISRQETAVQRMCADCEEEKKQ